MPINTKYADYAIRLAPSKSKEIILAKRIEFLNTQVNAYQKQIDIVREQFEEFSKNVIDWIKNRIKEIVGVIWELMRGGMTEREMIEREVMRLVGTWYHPYRPYWGWREPPILPEWEKPTGEIWKRLKETETKGGGEE